MTEINHGKQMPNSEPTLDAKEARKTLFGHLEFSLSVCREKSGKKKALNSDRQKWIRLLVFTVTAYSDLLKDVEIENLEERLSRLEQTGQPQAFTPPKLDSQDLLTRLREQQEREEKEAKAQQETNHD
jgi:hypothetical protein